MSQSEPASSGDRDRRYVVTTGVVERPVAERPTKDNSDAIAEWLVGAARAIPTGLQAFDEFAWRMLATGLPLLRVTLHSGTLHPQFLGTTFIWCARAGEASRP
jgi:adenylate cyclase